MNRKNTRKIMSTICFAAFTTFSSVSVVRAVTMDNIVISNNINSLSKETGKVTKDIVINGEKLTRQIMGKKEQPSDEFINAKTEEQAMENPLSQPKKGVTPQASNKAAEGTKYTLSQLASMNYEEMTNLLATISFFDITDLFQNSDGAKQFYNNSGRMDHLFSDLASRGASFTANDDKGIPTIEEVIRGGFYLGYYNPSDYPNMYTTATKNKTIPIYEAMLNNPDFRYGTDTQNYVMEAFGSLIGNSTCTTDIANRCVPFLREFRQNYSTYLQSISKGKAVYGIMAGIGYVFYTEGYEHYGEAPETLPSYGKIDGFIDELISASSITGLSTDDKWYTDNATYYMGQLSKFYSNQNHILRLLTDRMNSSQKYSADFFAAANQIHQSFNDIDADGRNINYEQLQNEGNEYWMPKHYTFDDGAITIQAGDKVSPEKIDRMYWATKEVESQFFRVYGNDKPLEPNNADKVLTIRLFNSPAEYQMNSYLNGIDTNNGGMYIEPYGTFYTYERTTQESVYSLEELFRHEFTHYLQGKYQVPGMWGQGDFYKNNELEWTDEGTAEFFAGSTRTEGVQPRQAIIGYFANDRAGRFTLDTLFRSGYASGWDFYNYGCAYIMYLYRNDINTFKKLNTAIMNNKIADFRNILNEQRNNSSVEDAYQNLMDQLIKDKASGKVGTPLVGDAYVQTHAKRNLSQIKTDIQSITGINSFTESKTKSADFGMFKLEGVYTGDTSTGEINDWKAMNAKANEMLKTLSTKGWTGYDTVTCYFTNYTVNNGRYQYNLVFRGLLNDESSSTVEPPVQNQAPIAAIDAKLIANVNESVEFNGSKSTDSDGNIVSYAWSFGDGGTGTGVRVNHTYLTPGIHTVTLKVTDDKGATGEQIFRIAINKGETVENKVPVAVIDGNIESKINTPLNFSGSQSTDSDGNIVSYVWNFGDGTTGTGVTASHSYAVAGTYTVTLTVTDDKGATGKVSVTVTIGNEDIAENKLPLAVIDAVATAKINESVNFNSNRSTDSDGQIVSYQWNFGDNTSSTQKNPSHVYTKAGEYTVVLTVKDNKGATASTNFKITVTDSENKLPVATIEGKIAGKINETLQFKGENSKDEDGQIVSFEWNFGDRSTSTIKNPSHVYTTEGTYTVTLKVTDDKGGQGQASTTVTITKDEIPVGKPIVSISGSSYEVANVSTIFSGKNCASSNGKIVKYEWNFGDGSTGTGKNIAHTFKTPGNYTVTLKVTDIKDQVEQSSINISISASNEEIVIPGNLSADQVYVAAYNATVAAQQSRTQSSINYARAYVRRLIQITQYNKPLHDALVGTLSSMLDPLQHNIFVNFYSIIYKADKITLKERLSQEEINDARQYVIGFLGAAENAGYVPAWSSAVDVFQAKNIEKASTYFNQAKASKSPVDIATANIYINELITVKNNEDVLNFAYMLQEELENLQ